MFNSENALKALSLCPSSIDILDCTDLSIKYTHRIEVAVREMREVLFDCMSNRLSLQSCRTGSPHYYADQSLSPRPGCLKPPHTATHIMILHEITETIFITKMYLRHHQTAISLIYTCILDLIKALLVVITLPEEGILFEVNLMFIRLGKNIQFSFEMPSNKYERVHQYSLWAMWYMGGIVQLFTCTTYREKQ